MAIDAHMADFKAREQAELRNTAAGTPFSGDGKTPRMDREASLPTNLFPPACSGVLATSNGPCLLTPANLSRGISRVEGSPQGCVS